MKPGIKKLPRYSRILGVAAVAWLGTGCRGVEPWQREDLAQYGMRPDRDGVSQRLREHRWFSREAANGGGRVGGGGCGCN